MSHTPNIDQDKSYGSSNRELQVFFGISATQGVAKIDIVLGHPERLALMRWQERTTSNAQLWIS